MFIEWLNCDGADAQSLINFDPADDLNPTWSSDGNRIVFTSDRKGNRDIYEKPANGTGEEQLLFQSNESKDVTDWSSDRKNVVYDVDFPMTSVWVLPLSGDRKPFPYVQANYNAQQGQLSPNGRFIAD